MFGERRHMGGIGTTRENARVNLRVERLHPAVEHFGEARVVRNLLDGKPCRRQKLRRSARREQMISRLGKASCEFDDARLVRNAEKCLLTHVFIS